MSVDYIVEIFSRIIYWRVEINVMFEHVVKSDHFERGNATLHRRIYTESNFKLRAT